MARALFIDPQTIKDKSDIDNNVDDSYIINATVKVQDFIIRPLIGTSLYDKIVDGIINDDLPIEYKNMVLEYMYTILINGCVSFLIKSGTYKITSAGVVKSGSADFPTLSNTELNSVMKEFQKLIDSDSQLLYDYLDVNSSTFPEFYETPDVGNSANLSLSTRDFYIDKNQLYSNESPYSTKDYF